MMDNAILKPEQLERLKLLSHSSDLLLHGCPIKYFITKLNPSFGRLDKEENPHFDFGSIIGLGVQEYLATNSREAAVFKMYSQWPTFIDSEYGLRHKKTFWHVIHALDRFMLFRATALRNYELISFNGIPAAELGFSIDCGDGFYYRGFLDAALWNVGTKQIVPFECKSTGSYNINESMYVNSSQGSAYKLVTDAISSILGLERDDRFTVMYSVYQTKQYEWQQMPFPKSHKSLAMFIRNLLTDKALVQLYMRQEYWPQHGEHCHSFGKDCHLLSMCDKSSRFYVREGIKYPDERDGRYTFQFKLTDLMDNLIGQQEMEMEDESN